MAMVLSATCQQYFGYIGAVSFYSWKKLEYRFKLSLSEGLYSTSEKVMPYFYTAWVSRMTKVHSIQHYVIKFDSGLRQVAGFTPGTPVSSTI